MISLIGSIFGFVLDLCGTALGVIMGAVGLVFDILGGLFSLIIGLIAFVLIAGLIFVVWRSHQKKTQAEGVPQSEEDEDFVSFYEQYRK